MKIGLILDDHLGRPGGVQKYILGLNDYLLAQNHEVKIITSGKQNPTNLPNVVALGTPLTIYGNLNTTSIPFPVSKKQIQQILDKEKFDLLHFAAPFSPTMGEKILRLSNSINIISFLVYLEKNNVWSKFLPLLSLTQNRSLKKIHGRIAISETAREFAKKFSPADYKIIPPGIDLKKFNPSTNFTQLFQDKKTNLLFVGRLEKRKGVRYLLEAFRLLQAKHPETRLLIAGQGPESEPAKKLAKALGLKNVEFLGFVPEKTLPQLYQSAEILVSPATEGESFGIVLLEAMACGLPIVAFANRGYLETLNYSPQKDFLVEPKNVYALSETLDILLTNRPLRKTVGAANLKEIKKYSWEKIGAQILSFYSDCQNKFLKRGEFNH